MASLVIIVAVLQYRWTTQLSAATEARIGSNIQPLMMGWHLDFYGEVSAICVALQVGPDSGARENWNDYLHRYVDWSRAATNNDSLENIYANPDLIAKIYIWETSDRAMPRLFRLNADTAKIEIASVPQDLQSLLARLQAKSSSLPVALHTWAFPDSSAEERSRGNDQLSPSASLRADKTTGWQFDKNIPAIVHPIVHGDRHSLRHDTQSPNSQNSVDWIVVVLNLSTIQRRVFPDLTKRYFSGREGLEYKLAVTSAGRTPRLIYSSDLGFPGTDLGAFDSRMNIFGPAPESVEGHFWQTIKNSESLRHEEWRDFSAPVWFPVIQYTSHDEPWMLLIQHRTGPLEAIAKSIWRRNLMTGSIVLLLLTVDMGLIIIASRRAQKLAKLQLGFVASVSHEIRTPLTAILSAGENVRDGLVDGREGLVEQGSIIVDQAARLADLVDQVLLFAATIKGKLRYTVRPLQVSEILECALRNTAVLLQKSGFTVEQQIEQGLPRVVGDLSAISRCLQNLIANAVKHSDKDRWIGLSARIDESAIDSKGVQISVQDRGLGISSSDLPRIFEPFYRSPRVVAAQIRGTGLGLSIAKSNAEALGGRLSVTSEVDVGSIFTLHLPVAEEDRKLAPVTSAADQGLQHEREYPADR